ncbi:dihydrolipoyllysine-residue acetyltransferase component 3 of pyruvate dehydrogenase complex, mitochondrial-like [Zingiber officinale]|uniref:dihydrolipoyllysine-residue acetyltransferase component 3 of pyruvate dehydrogenase complex, mitochondrial-like n=1 Tax=Zingiber officinale TaxID=94328 RepID=UPI001C4AB89E|nr:dihydrolipoyllysine-residue acetyltransferase component 3 of pyruvate dehydrogenase complex, mitochondrial-like [Zingiber officinale]
MTLATQVVRHSRKLKGAQNILLKEPSILARPFSKDISRSYNGTEGKYLDLKPYEFCTKSSNATGEGNAFSSELLGNNHSRKGPAKSLPFFGMRFSHTFSYMQANPRRLFSTNTDLPPHQAIGMPSLSPTMTEGNIARWLKKEGDKVSPDDVLCEVETDKATVEMECMEEGYLAKIIQGDGSKEIKVGETIAITVEEEGDIEKFKDYKVSESAGPTEVQPPSEPAQSKKEEVPTKTDEPKASKTDKVSHHEHRIFSSPLARKLAGDNNVSLSSIKGTGPDGRILKADVEDYLASQTKGVPAPVKAKESIGAQALGYVDIPNSQIRKVTASRLLLSKQTIPHYYLTIDTRVDKLIELRKELNSLQEVSGGKRLSINDLVIKATALALRKIPQCNSSWMNDFIRQYHNVNINVAVQTDNGLFVPVIKDADKKGLATIAEEVKVLAQKAKENSLKPEDYEGGTFTVSNLGGPFGIKQFCAIINPPQSAILAVGSAERRVLPGSAPDQFEFGNFMSVTLSCDHRVIDGAVGAEWLRAFKNYIENPQSMLL